MGPHIVVRPPRASGDDREGADIHSRPPAAPHPARGRRGPGARALTAILTAVLALAACSSGEDERPEAAPDSSRLVPSFAPESEQDGEGGSERDGDGGDGGAATSGMEQAPRSESEDADDASASPGSSPPDDEGPATPDGSGDEADAGDDATTGTAAEEPATVTSQVTDPAGDTTAPLLGSAPDAADLIAGNVERTGSGQVTVTIELAEAPEPPDEGTTMNVASFHDLTGDGEIDLELWLNHSEQGWFPSWRDNRAGEAAYGDESGLTLEVEGARLVLTVPAERVGDVTSWRWSLGLEWGRYEWLGTDAAAHDLAPDEGFVPHDG